MLIIFDDMIADILSNKKLIVKELFIQRRKLKISVVLNTKLKFFNTQS